MVKISSIERVGKIMTITGKHGQTTLARLLVVPSYEMKWGDGATTLSISTAAMIGMESARLLLFFVEKFVSELVSFPTAEFTTTKGTTTSAILFSSVQCSARNLRHQN